MIGDINHIIMLLSKGMSNRKLYFSDHPRVNSYASEVIEILGAYLTKSGAEECYIGIVDGFFVFEGKRVFGPSITGKQLMDFAESLHCGGFGLQRGLTVAELKNFFDISALRSVPVKRVVEARSLFANYGVKNIRIGDQYSNKMGILTKESSTAWEGYQVGGDGTQSPTFLFQKIYDVVTKAHGDASLEKNFDINNAKSVSEYMLQYVQSSFADVMQHVHYPDYDSYTVGHSVRVASLAVYVAHKMGLPKKDLLEIGTAALLHDIGKCNIGDEILFKNSRLSPQEYEEVKDHPRSGVEILLEQKGVSSLDLAACWGHHIRYDGGGYPLQPNWAISHPVTSLIHVCDVFEALTAVRPYKQALTPQRAYSVMLADKNGFHPGLLASFIRMVGLFPPGTFVRLSDRRVGLVSETGDSIDRPVLLIKKSQTGTPLTENDQYELNLSDPRQNSVRVDKLLLDYLE